MPNIASVDDFKPNMASVEDNKPKLIEVERGMVYRIYTRSIFAGAPMGLLLSITYTADETFNTSYNP